MSNITNTDAVVTESKLKDFYEDIKPFLGCPAYLTSEGNAEYYSTDEKVIGRWIDNKPLYQKVVYLNDNDPTTTWTSKNIPHNINNVDYISGYGFFQEAYDNNKSTFWLNTVSGNEYFRCTFNKTNITIARSSNWVMQGYAWIILNYTKTTDSAATTIQEDPNEYSTDEKIIGKWIDGKPIYQKTYQFNTISTSNSLGMTINPENIINFFGTVTNVENECLTLNCAHPQYQDIYGLFACIKSSTLEVRSINGREWSLNNLRSLKITLQYTKDSD